jgi:hypothetical protein
MTNDIIPTDGSPLSESDLHAMALKRLEDKRGLTAHTLAYVLVNLLLTAVWLATGGGFFWPLFPIFGWGIGLAFHVWSVLWPEPDPARVAREMERLRRRAS